MDHGSIAGGLLPFTRQPREETGTTAILTAAGASRGEQKGLAPPAEAWVAYQAGFAEERDELFAAKTDRLLVSGVGQRGPSGDRAAVERSRRSAVRSRPVAGIRSPVPSAVGSRPVTGSWPAMRSAGSLFVCTASTSPRHRARKCNLK